MFVSFSFLVMDSMSLFSFAHHAQILLEQANTVNLLYITRTQVTEERTEWPLYIIITGPGPVRRPKNLEFSINDVFSRT